MSDLSSEEQISDPPLNCPVELRGEGEPILVLGATAEGITGVAYRALEALCEAFPDGLTRQLLNRAAGSRDARRALQYLEKSEPWKTAQVIVSDHVPGKTPTVYRIAAYRTVWGWWVRMPSPYSRSSSQAGRDEEEAFSSDTT
jgi:hypothetical protein